MSVFRTNPLFSDESDHYEVVSMSSGYFSTYKKDTLQNSVKDWYKVTSSEMESRLPLPDLDVESSNIIFRKDSHKASDGSSNNWYLLRRLGSEDEGKFTSYRPSVQRNNAIFSDANMQGWDQRRFIMINCQLCIISGRELRRKKFSKSLFCKFFCITLLIMFFIFIIVIVSMVLSRGRTMFGSI